MEFFCYGDVELEMMVRLHTTPISRMVDNVVTYCNKMYFQIWYLVARALGLPQLLGNW